MISIKFFFRNNDVNYDNCNFCIGLFICLKSCKERYVDVILDKEFVDDFIYLYSMLIRWFKFYRYKYDC